MQASGKVYFHAMSAAENAKFHRNAEIAQLVEHNLAKVGVASSSLVFRSKSPKQKGQSNEETSLKRCFREVFSFLARKSIRAQ